MKPGHVQTRRTAAELAALRIPSAPCAGGCNRQVATAPRTDPAWTGRDRRANSTITANYQDGYCRFCATGSPARSGTRRKNRKTTEQNAAHLQAWLRARRARSRTTTRPY